MAKYYGKTGSSTGVKGVPANDSTTAYSNNRKPLTPSDLNTVESIDKQIKNQTDVLNRNQKPRKA